jgi:hypothetical protein
VPSWADYKINLFDEILINDDTLLGTLFSHPGIGTLVRVARVSGLSRLCSLKAPIGAVL